MITQLHQIAVIAAPLPDLSPDQRNILIELSQGTQNRQIADKLGLGIEKVKNEEQKLRHLLYARNRSHLVAIAIRHGLIANPNPYPEPEPTGARKHPYAFFVLPRDTLNRPPNPARTVAVVAVTDQLTQRWSIRMGGTLAWSGTNWDIMPAAFTTAWIAAHTWPFEQVFDIARDVARDPDRIRRRTQ